MVFVFWDQCYKGLSINCFSKCYYMHFFWIKKCGIKVPSLTGLLPIYFGLLICTVCDNNIKSPFICVVFCIVNNYQRLKFSLNWITIPSFIPKINKIYQIWDLVLKPHTEKKELNPWNKTVPPSVHSYITVERPNLQQDTQHS